MASSDPRRLLRDTPNNPGALFGAFLAAMAFAWHFADLHVAVQRWDAVSTARLAAGTGVVPMQYRVLLPALGGWLSQGDPAFDFLAFEWWVDWVGVVGVWLTTAWLLRAVLRGSATRAALLALGVLPLLTYHYVLPRAAYYYIYDIPSVAIFAGALAAILERRFWTFAAIFAIGTVNRETTAFLVVTYVIVEGREGRWRELLPRAFALTLLWAAIKGALWWRFQENVDPNYSGDLYKEVYERNWAALQHDARTTLHHVTSVFGYLWLPVALGLRGLRQRSLRWALLVCVPVVAAMFYVGLMEEIRIFGELLPLIYTAWLSLALGGYTEAPLAKTGEAS